MKKQIIAAFVGILILFGATYLLRYQIFRNWTANAVGDLNFNEDETMAAKINRYFEDYHSKKSNRPYSCAHNFWARDDRYIYVDLVCGKFSRVSDTEVKTEYGYQAPTRVTVTGSGEIANFEQPVDGTYNRVTYNWLFPYEVQEVDRQLESTDPWKNIHLKTFIGK
ncbi:hypothetical protein CIK05_05095 [Bdellovibrio sp. qaytius]|nr:hypothetical protein CIK05_05095 [Bdellovibrio sp. qaytius]